VHFYRWEPRFLALPVAPDTKRLFRMDSSGFGLALCLDDILGYDREQFIHLEDRFRAIFPQIKTIRLMQESAYRGLADDRLHMPMLEQADGKGIYFEFVNGQQVPASQTSDGVLLVLAYLTVLYLPPPYRPRVVLVEEPENGIHPKLLQDVLGILRDLIKEQTTSQVILTTHSPYVLDLFEPKEVSLCRMTADGSVSVHRLSESQTVREQLDIFTLGEIWTAEGDAALIPQGKPSEMTS
jgi:predicted ATPase